MKPARSVALFGVVLMTSAIAHAQPPRPPAPDETDLGPAVVVGDTIIRNYDPTPALVTKVTPVPRPKVPVTDIHAHWSLQLDAATLLAAMDDLGVERAVNLSGGFGPQLDQMLEKFHAAAPGRLVIFANLDMRQVDDPQFGQRMAAMLEAAHAKGVAGLKICKSLGLTIKDKAGTIVPVDDPRFDPIWDACGALGIPVLIHSADPIAFFDPIDEKNERWMQLHRHPDWSFHGPQFPTFAEVLQQHDAIVARHPKTTFISAHMGKSGRRSRGTQRAADAPAQSGRRPLGPCRRARPPAVRGATVPAAVAGPRAVRHRSLSGSTRPAPQPHLLPLSRDRRRVLQVLRPPVPADRRVADLWRAPARRGASQDLSDERRPRARPTREIDWAPARLQAVRRRPRVSV